MVECTSLEECCTGWALSRPERMFKSALANLYRVKLPSGEAGALKVFTPLGLKDEWDGALLMKWYAGNGAAEILALSEGALLMKWLDGGNLIPLCNDGQGEDAAVIIARLAANVRRQRLPAPRLKTIEQRFEFLLNFDVALISAEFRANFQMAINIAKRMLADVQQYVPLHADLHFENVLFDGTQWRLIDPKGLMGPPAYDLANLFINPWGRDDIVMAEGRAVALVKRLSVETGIPVAELIGWAVAHAALATAWRISVGHAGLHPLRALEALIKAHAKIV